MPGSTTTRSGKLNSLPEDGIRICKAVALSGQTRRSSKPALECALFQLPVEKREFLV